MLHAAGEPMRLEEVALAEPGPGEVLVRVQAAGVCHSDLHYMTGDLTCRLPAILGHEGAGVVERTGPDVRGVAPGDAVVLMWRPRHREGRLPLDTLLGARYRLDEINEAFARLPSQSVGRGLIMIGES